MESGESSFWAWAANEAADEVCMAKSASVFIHAQAKKTADIDAVTYALCSMPGKRCAHMLVHDKVTKKDECKFQAVRLSSSMIP